MKYDPINDTYLWLDEIHGQDSFPQPDATAERVLSEAVEVALECGCGRESILAAVHWELGKAERRGQLDGHKVIVPTKLAAELGGVMIQLVALSRAANIGLQAALEAALKDYRGRSWYIDRRGALWSRGSSSGREVR